MALLDIDVTSLDGSDGFEILGASAGDGAGYAVSSAGDVNGDGFDDLIVGAPGHGSGGAAYVLFGGGAGFSNVDLLSLSPTEGFALTGGAGDEAGTSVASAGDLNGDGFADLLVGAPGNGDAGTDAGAVYVVYGGTGLGDLAMWAMAPSDGYKLTGAAAGDQAGFDVAAAGDVDGDGFDDLIIGAPRNDDAGSNAGAAYVLHGRPTPSADLSLAAVAAHGGTTIPGGAAGNQAGFAVSAAGDVNGDGFDDLIVGAYGDDTGGNNAGAAWVVFGPGAAASDVDLAALGGGGYRITGAAAGDRAGIAVAAAGDVNADGFDDLIVGAHLNDAGGISAGAAYVLLGGNGSADVDLVSPAADGLRILGAAAGDMAGMSVSAAGDIDGDGFDDLIVGVRYNDSGDADAGAAYVILGSDLSQSVTHAGTDSGDVLTGTAFADIIVGGRGDDTITGNGGTDVLEGGAGDDTISVPDLDFLRVDGGGGTDTIILDGSGIDFDLGLIADNRIASIEAIDITGASPNTLTLGLADVINTTGPSNTLAVIGDGDDTVIVTDSVWTLVDPHVGGFALYRSGGATLKVDLDIGDLSFDTGVGISAPLGAAFKIIGEAESDFAGNSVSSAGDVNGDGFDDLIVGAKFNEEGGTRAGAAYVVFGKGDGFANIDLGALAPAEGFKIVGEALLNDAGAAVSSAGDVNGDGFDDLIVGAPGDDEGGGQFAGAAYVVFGKAGGFTDVDLATLAPADGFKIVGEAAFDYVGDSVSSAGDVDGDGFGDLIVGARNNDEGGSNASAAYVVFGKASGFADVDLGALGTDGFQIVGEVMDDRAGTSVSSAGDVNGDGFDDLIAGTPYVDDGATTDTGAAYVVFGRAGGFTDIDLSTLADADGFMILGEAASDRAGYAVSSAGDLDGDGFDDMLVGAVSNHEGGSSAGAAYTVFGGNLTGAVTHLGWEANDVLVGTAAADVMIGGRGDDVLTGAGGADVLRGGAGDDTLEIADTTFARLDGGGGSDTLRLDGSGIALDLTSVSDNRLTGIEAIDITGNSPNSLTLGVADVLAASDSTNTLTVIGDGDDTLTVTGTGWNLTDADDGGFRVYGQGAATLRVDLRIGTVTIDAGGLPLSALDGTNGFKIVGEAGGDRAGKSVSSAGDVNGDGFDDMVVGAFGNDAGGSAAGAAYVLFGKAGGFGDVDLATLGPADGFKILGEAAFDWAGQSVSSAGDLNGDGFADLIVGAVGNDDAGSTAGAAYVVFGKASGFADIDLVSLGADGFKLVGEAENDNAGRSVSSAGDVNGDGFDDFVVGAPFNDGGVGDEGAAYVVFGKASGFADIDLASLGAGGFKIVGEDAADRVGFSVSSAGDTNGDGFADLIVGATLDDDGGTNAGAAYVVFGKAGGISDIDVGALTPADGFKVFGDGHISLTGYSVSSASDTNGDGYDDLLVGKPRDDEAATDAGTAYMVFGGNLTGAVTHEGGDSDDDLAGTGGADAMVGGRGDDTLTGSGGADVMRGGAGNDILAIADAGFAHLDGGNGTDTLRLDGSGIALDLTAIADNRVNGIEAIDITGNSPNTLTMGIADILGASGTANTLTVVGDGDDAVTVTDGVWTLVDRDDGGFRVFESGAATLKVDTGIEDLEIAARIDLGNLAGGNGFKIVGEAAYDYAGFSASNAGDINGDGFDDVIVGARYNDEGGGSAGAAYVIFGAQNGLGDVDLATMPPSAGFKIVGEAIGDQAGRPVSSAGDVNGDGFDDLVVGAYLNDEGGITAGAAYVLFGKASGFADVDLDTLGTGGFKIIGTGDFDSAEYAVSSAGDVNGDGFADLIVGAHGNDDVGSNAGAAYVVFGKASGFGTVDLGSLGTAGFKLAGEAASDNAGVSVSTAGDVNGDGFADLIVGARYNGEGGTAAGAAYVVFGKASGFTDIGLATLDGTNGFKMVGGAAYAYAGRSVSSAGDVNGDGFDDVVVGAYGDAEGGSFAGAAFVVFGKASGFADVDLGALGSDGFKIVGAAVYDFAASSVSSAGDVNGDGFADLIIGATGDDEGGTSAGAAYVVFGKADGFGDVDLGNLAAADGFKLVGEDVVDNAGSSVSAAGDVDGDGYDDLVVGAHLNDEGGSDAGAAYVIYGDAAFGQGGGVQVAVGSASSDTLIGGLGEDILHGAAAGDVVDGAEGTDTVDGGKGDDTVSGGAGSDTLTGGDGADVVYGYTDPLSAWLDFADGIVFPDVTEVTNIGDLETPGDDALGVADDGFAFGGDAVATLSFVDSQAGYHNTLGLYTIAEDGTIGDVRIVYENVQALSAGDSTVFSVPDLAETDIGFFAVVHGDRLNDGYQGLDLHGGTLSLVFDLGGAGERAAQITDDGADISLVLDDASGRTVLEGPLIHSTERGASATLNADGTVHVASGRADGADAAKLRLGFEDTPGGGAGDYNDVVFDLEVVPINGDDTLSGGAGNDTLVGGAGDDTLLGGNGSDDLVGGAGNDVLIGGAGNDGLTGGVGDDLFVFDDGEGIDTIADFEAGAGSDDVIDVTAVRNIDSFAELQAKFSDNGTDTTIQLDAENSIVVLGVTVADLHQDDFLL